MITSAWAWKRLSGRKPKTAEAQTQTQTVRRTRTQAHRHTHTHTHTNTYVEDDAEVGLGKLVAAAALEHVVNIVNEREQQSVRGQHTAPG